MSRINVPKDDSVDIMRRTLNDKQHHRSFYDLITNDLVNQVILYQEVGGNPALIHPMNLRNYTDTDDNAKKRKNH